jgi:glucan phosphoethanolaminetransferase (alkaline phosphatase superfamily)
MQLILLIVFFIVALALVCWGILKGNSFVRILAALSAIILACYVSFGFGVAWERLRTMDTVIGLANIHTTFTTLLNTNRSTS